MLQSIRPPVKSQIRFLFFLPVTFETTATEDRIDIAHKFDRSLLLFVFSLYRPQVFSGDQTGQDNQAS